jgi:uncharacterized protein (DUF1501 family)
MDQIPAYRLSRRHFLGHSLLGTLGLVLSPAFQRLLAKEEGARRAKRCILVWLDGGPSHIDTFDPKPGADTNGPFKPISTSVPGLQLCEHLPNLAAQAKHLTVLRSLTSNEADHDRAYQFLHTGNPRDETIDYPALGSVLAREWSAEDGDLPSFVSVAGSGPGSLINPQQGAGFFGAQCAPYVIANLDAPVENIKPPEGVAANRHDRRLGALATLNRGFTARTDPDPVADQERLTAKALRFQKSAALKAFDLSSEKPEVLKAYGAVGDNPLFGKACILARRLVESGVRFVEVTLGGWDTHADNFNQVAAQLKLLDPALAALTADLADRGLLKDTLVLCMGEFGRTPKINANQGRDHWSEAFSAVLAGGGVKGGQVLGASDAKGEKVKDRPVTPRDLFATLLSAFGVDGKKTYRTPGGRPIRLADKGQIVSELFG